MSDQTYYENILKRGVDLNFYGHWQKAYAKMVIFITNSIIPAANNRHSKILDIGCACGSVLRGFKDSQVFKYHVGVDKNKYMLKLGRETHNFKDDELLYCDISTDPLPCNDNSVTLINCSNVLENIPKDKLRFVINEMHRVLNEDGCAFINIPIEKTISELTWWKSLFSIKFSIDPMIEKLFLESRYSPDGNETFYNHYKYSWTIFGLRKEK